MPVLSWPLLPHTPTMEEGCSSQHGPASGAQLSGPHPRPLSLSPRLSPPQPAFCPHQHPSACPPSIHLSLPLWNVSLSPRPSYLFGEPPCPRYPSSVSPLTPDHFPSPRSVYIYQVALFSDDILFSTFVHLFMYVCMNFFLLYT